MNFVENFNNFYDNLTPSDLFVFWILVFFFFFLFFLCITLIIKNRQLKRMLIIQNYDEENQNEESKNEEKVIISEEETIKPIEEVSSKEVEEKEDKTWEINPPKTSQEEVTSAPYSKNVLKQMRDSQPTSPINLSKKEQMNLLELDNAYTMKTNSLNNENKDNKVEENISFVEELSSKLEKELEPKTIELTDYERKQEEEAIISYQELLSKKDKLYNITEEEETEQFIDELKNFRLDLE